MADSYQSTADSVVVWYNADGATSAGESWWVRKWSTAVDVFGVSETGDSVTLTGLIQRAGTVQVENTASGSGTIATIQKNGTDRLIISYVADTQDEAVLETPAASDYGISLRSAKDVRVVLDTDASGGKRYLKIRNASDTVGDISNDGDFSVWDPDIGPIVEFLASASSECQLYLGSTSTTHNGVLAISADTTNVKAGILKLQAANGTWYWLWCEHDTYTLRIHTSDPGTNDAAGVAVGTNAA